MFMNEEYQQHLSMNARNKQIVLFENVCHNEVKFDVPFVIALK